MTPLPNQRDHINSQEQAFASQAPTGACFHSGSGHTGAPRLAKELLCEAGQARDRANKGDNRAPGVDARTSGDIIEYKALPDRVYQQQRSEEQEFLAGEALHERLFCACRSTGLAITL